MQHLGLGDLLGFPRFDQVEQIAVQHNKIGRLARFNRADQLVLAHRAGPVDGVGIEHLLQRGRLLRVVGWFAGNGPGNACRDVHKGPWITGVDRCITACHQHGAGFVAALHRVDRSPGVTVFVVEHVVDVLALFALLQEWGDQHVIFRLLVDPGVGIGEVHAQFTETALIVRVNDLQVGNAVGDMTVAIALASRLQRIDRHTRGPIAHAVDMDAETIGIERTGVVLEVFGLVIDDAVVPGIDAVLDHRDGPGVVVQFEVRRLVVVQHAGIGRERRLAEGVAFKHAVREDLHGIGLDQRVIGKSGPHVLGFFQVSGDIHLALVVVLDKAGGGGDPHVQQALLLHLHKLPTDKVVAAGILDAGDTALGHDFGNGRQNIPIDLLAARIARYLGKHIEVADRDSLFGSIPDHPGVQADIRR